jgi:hypothetical protein
MKLWRRHSFLARLLLLVITFDFIPSRVVWITAQAPSSALLEIVIVEGDGAINNVKKRTSREAIVEVQDENHKPVAGAIVSFTLPNTGPGGTFVNGSRLFMVTTDQAGRAAATSIRANSLTGSYNIRVTASFQGQTATATIAQTNAILAGAAAGAGAASGGLFGIGIPATIAVVGAAAAGAAFGVNQAINNNSSKTVKVSVGTPTLP